MPISYNEISSKSFGGTELQARALENIIDKDLLSKVQIIPSRVRELDNTRHKIYWCHDLPGDPESSHLANEGWRKFHRIVFVSHWQKQQYINYYNIPYSKCVVIQNAIEPIDDASISRFLKPEIIKFIYHTTPHRGLQILIPVFKKLQETYKNIHLDVYSSFSMYGWNDRDKDYDILFKEIDSNEGMINHGFKSNDEIRQALKESHIFAYPNIWPETSCLSLIEAMSAGNICIHSDFAALPETAANWTAMYSFHEEMDKHASTFYHMMITTIDFINSNEDHMLLNKLKGQQSYVNLYYSWDIRKIQWENFLQAVISEPLELSTGPDRFVYRVQ